MHYLLYVTYFINVTHAYASGWPLFKTYWLKFRFGITGVKRFFSPKTRSGADPRMVRIGTGPPFWQINHANSAYFRLFLGYFGVISANRPPLFTYPGSSPGGDLVHPPNLTRALGKGRMSSDVLFFYKNSLMGNGSDFLTQCCFFLSICSWFCWPKSSCETIHHALASS